MKKILSFLTILVLLGSFAPQVFGADGYVTDANGNRIYYKIFGLGTNFPEACITYPGTAHNPWPSNYTKPRGRVIIPQTIQGYNVDRILGKCFAGCRDITSVDQPGAEIGDSAFQGCSALTSITLEGTRYIGNYAFDSCISLTSSISMTNIITIGSYAFNRTGRIASVTLSNRITAIGDYAFYGSGLISITIPTSVTSIGRSAFQGSGLTSITIPSTVTSIGQTAFYGCPNLTSVTIGDFATPINNTSSIGPSAFERCTGLTSVTVGNPIRTIGGRAFSYCTGLRSLTIGYSVGSIDKRAFEGCSRLTEIRAFTLTAPTLVRTTMENGGFTSDCFPFRGVPNTATIYIKCGGSMYSYQTNWRDWWDTVYFSNFIYSPMLILTAQSGNPTQGSARVLSQASCSDSLATVSATANSGYAFDHWSDGSTNNPYTLRMTSDSTLTAYFAAAATVTVLSDNTTMGTVSGGGTYALRRTATLTATPNHGYFFTQWRDGNTQNPRTVTVTADTTFIAFFAPYSYPINVVSANDTMGSVRGGGTYNYGTTVIIAATANSGYRFARWHDGITNATRSVVVTDSATYTAYFELDEYTITAVSGNSTMGSVSGGGNYAAGSNATLTATANDGYHFRYWQDRDITNPRTVTVVGDATYTAFFAPNSYTVTAVPNDAAWGSIRGGGTYDYGATATLTANANSGYHFDHWSDSTTANPYALTVTGDVNLIAYFVSDGGSNSILDIEASDISVYTAEGRICVTLDGQTTDEFNVYDVMGRRAAYVIASDKSPVLPAGVYIVKVGTLPARKVVVIR